MSLLRSRLAGFLERFGEPVTLAATTTGTFPSVLSTAQARIYAENVSVDTSLRPIFILVIRGDVSIPTTVNWRGGTWSVLAQNSHSVLGVVIARSIVVALPV